MSHWVTSVYLHKENLPEAQPLLCIRCGKKWCVMNRNILAITNTLGMAVREIPAGMGYVEHKCRGCQMVYRVLFQ